MAAGMVSPSVAGPNLLAIRSRFMSNHANDSRRLAMAIIGPVIVLLGLSGCSSSQWARVRRSPLNPLAQQLELNSRQGPQPTSRTLQMLRRNDLEKDLEKSPLDLIANVQQVAYSEPTAENVYAIAEVAYVGAKRLEESGEHQSALNLHATAAANAYFYLFDEALAKGRNPYDPRFRRACDLYNNSLESALRYINSLDLLKPGGVHTIASGDQVFDFQIATRGTWQEANFCQLKFVSDFHVENLKNVYRTYGLGVPLIAVYRSAAEQPGDQFYPPGMSFPVTAFMRIVESTAEEGCVRHQCLIELHDPMVDSEMMVEGKRIPLETDLTTPLAYSLDNPVFKRANVQMQNLVKEQSLAVSGLYLLEPYDARKVPVVMVHGFWSSLVTWMEMFNDLRGSPEIRENYQFWFYLYPTGVPPLFTAAHLREQLASARQSLDPYRERASLDQMVLVGHSMGGLVSKLQTVDSGDRFWRLVSERGFSQLVASEDDKSNLRNAFFFAPNTSVRRVVTIATPFQGSNFSNMATQWLGGKLINLPDDLVQTRARLVQANPHLFDESSLRDQTTSVASLASDSPLLRLLENSPTPPWVKFHNIIGVIDRESMISAVAQDSDGVVKIASARAPGAVSEIVVPSDHVNVHRHPLAIKEVRRILLEHLYESRGNQEQPYRDIAGLTAVGS